MKFGLFVASALAFSELADATFSKAQNLLENGNFEQPALTSGYRFLDNFPGWKGTGPVEQGIGSIYNKNWGKKVVVELDAHENYCISQKVKLNPGCYHFELDYAGREGHLESSAMQVFVNGQLMEKVGAKETCIYNLDFDIRVECPDSFEFKICGTGTSNSYGMTIGNAHLSYTQVQGGSGGLTWGQNGWFNRPIINVQPVIVNPINPVNPTLPVIPNIPKVIVNPVVVNPTNPIYVTPTQPIVNPINIEPVYVKPTIPVYVRPDVPTVGPINIEPIYTKPVTGVTVNPYVPTIDPIRIEQAYVNQIQPVVVNPINPVIPTVNFPTGPITIRCDTGRYLSRCTSCGAGAYGDSASVSQTNPKSSDAIWTAIRYGDKIALRGDTGRYLGKCSNCWSQGAYSDSAFVHVSDASQSAMALWIPELLANGKWGLKSAETGKYLSRCSNCVGSGAYSDFAFVQADNCSSSAAQWEVASS